MAIRRNTVRRVNIHASARVSFFHLLYTICYFRALLDTVYLVDGQINSQFSNASTILAIFQRI